jgi:DNA segregation ATPase FtsK/SpoIIIE-like protein
MVKEKRRLSDLITHDKMMSSLGVFVCLLAAFGALNTGAVSNFITWVISYFVGGIFTYVFYLVIFVYGVSLIVASHKIKFHFNLTILGLIILSLGTLILVTNSMTLDEGGSYLTFEGDKFKTSYDTSISLDRFPMIDLTKNCGIFGLLMVAIINSGMTSIGSYVIGSILLCFGLMFLLVDPLKMFKDYLKEYKVKVITKKKEEQSFLEASDLELDLKSASSVDNPIEEEKKVEAPKVDKELVETKVVETPAASVTSVSNAEDQRDVKVNQKVTYDQPIQFEGLKKARIHFDSGDDEHETKSSETAKQVEVVRSYISEVKVAPEPVDVFSMNDPASRVSSAHVEETEVTFKDKPIGHQAPTIESQKPLMTPPISEKKVTTNKVDTFEDFKVAPLDLLENRADSTNNTENEKLALTRQETINKLLQDFSLGATCVGFQIGPSVTRFDIKADSDTSIAKFDKYMDDLSARLAGASARFVPVVKGKTTSGIEVSNAKTNLVNFKDVLTHLPPNDDGNNGLVIPFGKGISGNYVNADLKEFPHLLIAGSTKSGKSVFINTIILTLILRNTPEQLKLFLVDPKMVEFTKYHDIPHLLAPVCTEPDEAYLALCRLQDFMNERYKEFQRAEVTNIKEYNRYYAAPNNLAKMPYIVAIIDEYSDLVDSNKKISEPVLILAQKARACGVHLIVATQAPRANIITGMIKANFPARVALLCASFVDSMNIIDSGGAEKLLGNGDMLVKAAAVSTGELVRVQGSFVGLMEIRKICDHYRNNCGPEYDESFMNLKEKLNANLASSPYGDISARKSTDDPLYPTIRDYAMSMEYCSISKITRTFNIGFSRAGKLFQQLINDGIIENNLGSSNTKGCKVLLRKDSSQVNDVTSVESSYLKKSDED